MFGAELVELVGFGRQIGLAIAGAASLWGTVFFFRSKHRPGAPHCLVYEWVSARLFWVFYIGFAIASLSWLFLAPILKTHAHEGITLAQQPRDVLRALDIFGPAFSIWVVLALAVLFFRRLAIEKFNRSLGWLHAVNFLFAVVLISFPVWSGEFSRAQWFFLGHSVHSIFTVGTVIILDFLLIISARSNHLKQHIFPWFPTISKVIWVGLGLDFLSVAIVFNEAIALTPKFLFMQTVIGILIVNGVLLSGPITRKLLKLTKKGAESITKRWLRIAETSGIISISSWLSVTFIDFFENLTLDYLHFLAFYVLLVGIMLVGRKILTEIEKQKDPELASGA